MNTDEIFENRRSIAKKICKAIRDNGGQLLNASFFPERPFCDDANSYKFSSANFFTAEMQLWKEMILLLSLRSPRD